MRLLRVDVTMIGSCRVPVRWLAAMVLVLVALGSGVTAHERPNAAREPVAVPDEVLWRPTAMPDRILLSWTGDPSHSQAVTWRTDRSVQRAFAQIAVAEHGPLFVNRILRQEVAATQELATNLGTAHYHTVSFQGLQPRQCYAYRVGDGVNWSEWNQFTTASDRADPFTFVYFGDAQNEVKSHWSRVVREAFRDAPRAAFLLHAGDLINRGDNDAEWGEWCYASGFIHRSVPVIATPGNHEYKQGNALVSLAGVPSLTPHWRAMFAFPEHGPDRLAESVYWIDYQGTRIVSLNSNERTDEQVAWLDQVLSDPGPVWKIVTCHHPIYSAKLGRDNPELRALWQPLFDKHQVDLVLQGHDHTYARTRQMRYRPGAIDELEPARPVADVNLATGAAPTKDAGGTVYVVSVSGPKMYELGQRPFMVRAAEDTQLYQIISIDGPQLRYEARTAIGTLYDAFTLRKHPGRADELENHVPDIPELRRPVEGVPTTNE